MKTILKSVLLITSVFISLCSFSQSEYRKEVNIPDIPGYHTLKCDFHIHTVYSDGLVYPKIRAEEAFRYGLDAYAITDHVEYHPYAKDNPFDFEKSYNIALPLSNRFDLIQIKGAEITRPFPVGHFNAIFLKDIKPLLTNANEKSEFNGDTVNYFKAIKTAYDQGAFIFFNHPVYINSDTILLTSQQKELFETGMVKGIEIVNGRSYYPKHFQWAIDNKITILCNSDIHDPINNVYDYSKGEHRPITLVFAKEKTADAIKDALLNQRTAVYSENKIMGDKKFLEPIFNNSVKIQHQPVDSKSNAIIFKITNNADIDFDLSYTGKIDGISAPSNLLLKAHQTSLVVIKIKQDKLKESKSLSIPYTVRNLITAPSKTLDITLKADLK